MSEHSDIARMIEDYYPAAKGLGDHIDALEAWKAEALSVTPPLQEIGRELGVPLGESIHDKILPGIVALKAENQRLREALGVYADENRWQFAFEYSNCRKYFASLEFNGYALAQRALNKKD